MFGIFYALFGGTMRGAAAVKKTWENEVKKEEAKRNGKLTYHGYQNELRLVENDRQVVNTFLDNGDHVIKDILNDVIYINMSKEEREKDKIKAINNNKTIVRLGDKYTKYIFKNSLWNNINVWWIGGNDVYTEHPVNIVNINGIYFYLDLITGNLLRKIDGETEEKKIGSLTSDEIINYFNSRQDNIREYEKFNNDKLWTKKYYFMEKQKGIMDKAGVLKIVEVFSNVNKLKREMPL